MTRTPAAKPTRPSSWTPALHNAAKARAVELHQQALDAAFGRLGAVLKQLLGGHSQPEA